MAKRKGSKPVVDGIEFDSDLEADYYVELKSRKEYGEIVNFSLQPKFTLQGSFKKYGKTFQSIKYTADFDVLHHYGKREIVDIKSQGKGGIDAAFGIRKRMFDFLHPDLTLLILTKCPKKYGGGWIDVWELDKLRGPARKAKKGAVKIAGE